MVRLLIYQKRLNNAPSVGRLEVTKPKNLEIFTKRRLKGQIKIPAPNMNTLVIETSPLVKGRSFFSDDTGHVVDRGNHLVCKLNLQMYKNKGTQR